MPTASQSGPANGLLPGRSRANSQGSHGLQIGGVRIGAPRCSRCRDFGPPSSTALVGRFRHCAGT
eukprot:12389094-Alexandrium_andersonii.AAC.1